MAIYLNDKALKADKEGSRLEREYYEGLQKVNKLFDKFRVNGSDTSYIQIARKVEDSQRIFSMVRRKLKKLPTIALPIEVPYYDDEMGATLIRYSSTPPQRDSNGKLSWSTKYLEFRENLTITEKQKDLAWFLLFASNLIRKGVYQMVDVKAKYEGTFEDIIAKKEVIDSLTSGNEDLARHIAKAFLSEGFAKLEYKELVVKLLGWVEDAKKWTKVNSEIKAFNSRNILKKEKVSAIEWDGEEVTIQPCPEGVNANDLKEEAKSLGIKLTVPPQTKDVLYSLIQHVKSR